jgi:hypothetical protein
MCQSNSEKIKILSYHMLLVKTGDLRNVTGSQSVACQKQIKLLFIKFPVLIVFCLSNLISILHTLCRERLIEDIFFTV